MRTVEHSKNTDYLGRYYTDVAISRLLVNSLPAQQPLGLIDLGAGEGSLSLEASARWDRLNLVTVDVDHKASKVLAQRLVDDGFCGRHHHVLADALDVRLQERIPNMQTRTNAAVCNPPFVVPAWRQGYASIVEDAGFSGTLPAITSTDAATIFLAQNLRLLEPDGTVAIIVPDSLASAAKYRRWRSTLVQRYDLQHAIRLPRGVFQGTDALAHILVIAKRSPSAAGIRLSVLQSSNGRMDSIVVGRELAAQRLDYVCHVSRQQRRPSLLQLADVVLDLRRGTLNSAQARKSRSFVLHTTDIQSEARGTWFDFSFTGTQVSQAEGSVIAQRGDILVCRVGRNAADKVIGVCCGYVAISDCIYRIRVAPEYQSQVMHSLTSPTGREWLIGQAYGVAARQLSKSDLLRLPLDH
jgi:type I restriction enzyme M protein